MMLYALGALRLFDSIYDITEVSMSIYQPRRENVSTWTISVDELNAWAENTLKPKAELAHKGEGDYLPGPWCQFCKAAVKCRARAEEKLQLARFEFAPPPLLSDEEIEDILTKLDDLTKWASEIQAYAQDAAVNHGKVWRGFKLVATRTNRRYTDEEAVIQAAKDAGYTDIFKKSLIPITEMEKFMSKNDVFIPSDELPKVYHLLRRRKYYWSWYKDNNISKRMIIDYLNRNGFQDNIKSKLNRKYPDCEGRE
jgi:hypothetical protein